MDLAHFAFEHLPFAHFALAQCALPVVDFAQWAFTAFSLEHFAVAHFAFSLEHFAVAGFAFPQDPLPQAASATCLVSVEVVKPLLDTSVIWNKPLPEAVAAFAKPFEATAKEAAKAKAAKSWVVLLFLMNRVPFRSICN